MNPQPHSEPGKPGLRLLIPAGLFLLIGTGLWISLIGGREKNPPAAADLATGTPASHSIPANESTAAAPAGVPLAQTAAGGASTQHPAQKSTPASPLAAGAPEAADGRPAPLQETMAQPASVVFTGADGRQATMKPDSIGVFPRQHIVPDKEVTMRVSYPEGKPGDLVVAAVEDGGSLEGGAHSAPLHLDDALTVAFRFQPTAAPGLFRVTLQKGIDAKVVEMWAGPEPRLQGE